MKDDFGKDVICESEGKICYTKREAGNAINRAKQHYHSDESNASKDIPKRKYYCEKCGHYHLTSQAVYRNQNDKLQKKYRYKKEKLRERENKYDWREEYSLLYVA